MNTSYLRANELNIDVESSAFCITNGDLIQAIAEEVDLETVTNHELREIFNIVRRQLSLMNWKMSVADVVNHLPFGLNQTSLAWDGQYPCEGCPDAMIEDGQCNHGQECKAWKIFDMRFS